MKPQLPKFTTRVKVGLAFIYLAGLCWIADLLIPFQSFKHKGPVWVAVLIVAELSFVAGVAVLGKPVYRRLKHQFIELLKRRSDS